MIVIAHHSGGPLYDIVVPSYPIENILSTPCYYTDKLNETSSTPICSDDCPYADAFKDTLATQNGCGFLADSVLEYSSCMDYIYNNPEIYQLITENARNNLKKFSNDAFIREFMNLMIPYLKTN